MCHIAKERSNIVVQFFQFIEWALDGGGLDLNPGFGTF